jgi:uncharacterized protein
MKFVLVLAAVCVLYLMLRGALRRRTRAPRREQARSAGPQAMLTCAHCGVHMPRDEALPGRGGVFCDAAHRAAYEKSHPDA